MGAWIETNPEFSGKGEGLVAPFMGAWIETTMFACEDGVAQGCSLYGSMD